MKQEDQSRNTWIKRDQPSDVSTHARYKDGYEDILDARRHSSDLKWALKTRKNVPRYKYNIPRTATEVKTHVINSDRVKYIIEQLAHENGVSTKELEKEAIDIVEEMGHNLNLRALRGFAFTLIKVFKQLFNRIYVNEEGVQQLRQLLREYPVVLMPTHRSYMDFLLVSYIFFEYDLPLPVIAAAMDFKGMKFFGWLLRNCGAFYIRRTFGTDRLYWAVFTEYVQTQLRNGDAPVEFFVEGTRSRTAKSYAPRVGMLSAALESYFKAEVPDMMIVPISISYDRILEESLYAYELLGIPKPKESTSGLFKARNILSEDFGSIHFHISKPISVRQMSTPTIDRVLHALEPRYINNLSDKEQALSKNIAYRIILDQQQHLVISPWSLMATVLMQSREGISLKQLGKEVDWLKRQAYNLGGYVDWPGDVELLTVLRHYLDLHTNVVDATNEELIVLKLVKAAHIAKPVKDEVMLNAATNLILGSYRNQLTHTFIRVGLVSLAINNCVQETITKEELFKKYQFLERLLSKDFIFMPGETRAAFEHAVLNLSHSGGLVLDGDTVLVKRSITKHTTFLSQMFEPFLAGYWVLCHHLLSLKVDVHGRPLPKKPKDLAKDAQLLGIRLIQEGVIKHYEVLSLDVLGNGLNTLVDLGAMHRDKRNTTSWEKSEPWISPNNVVVSTIADDIGSYIEVPSAAMIALLAKSKSVVLPAKL